MKIKGKFIRRPCTGLAIKTSIESRVVEIKTIDLDFRPSKSWRRLVPRLPSALLAIHTLSHRRNLALLAGS